MSDKARDVLFLIGIYVSMIAGMAAKALFDHLSRGTSLEWKNFLLPLLVSPMVYVIVFKIVKESNETVLMLIFGFQNGFFWQDVFRSLSEGGASR
jgi:hypothetical protein